MAAMLDGTWHSAGARLGDQVIEQPTTRLVIAGAAYVVESPLGRDEGRLELRAEAEPWGLDLIGTSGPNAGQVLRAIVRVRGTLLQLAYDAGWSGWRPRDFSGQGGTSIVAVRYRRAS